MTLRIDHRPARRRRFLWKRWEDITALLGAALVGGFAVYAVLMAWSGA